MVERSLRVLMILSFTFIIGGITTFLPASMYAILESVFSSCSCCCHYFDSIFISLIILAIGLGFTTAVSIIQYILLNEWNPIFLFNEEKLKLQLKNIKTIFINIFHKILNILNIFISFMIGVFIFTIIKVIFSLLYSLLVKINLLSPMLYIEYFRIIEIIVIILSIYFAIKITPNIKKIKSKKTRIILKIILTFIGLLSGIFITLSNHQNKYLRSLIDDSPLSKSETISNDKAVKMAKLFVRSIDNANTSYKSNSAVTQYQKAVGETIIFDRYDHTIMKSEYMSQKEAIINFYENSFCGALKPIIKYGVKIQVNQYDKENKFMFTFYPNCK